MPFIKRYFYLTAIGAIAIFVEHTPSFAATFFTDEASWLAATTNVELFKFTGSNIATANEVTRQPNRETNLRTRVLTFDAANTGLSRGFTLTALNPGHDWVFQDRRVSETLSAGDIDSRVLGNDDFEVTGFTGTTLTAFGFDLINNNLAEDPESLSVYGLGDVFLGSIALPLDNGTRFLGVVSDVAIARIQIDEGGSVDEDTLIANFRFADASASVPEPSAIPSMGIAAFFLGFARWVKTRRKFR